MNSARQYVLVSTSCLYDVALFRKSVQDIVSYVEDSKELYHKVRHTFRDIAFLTIGLPVAKPKIVLSSMYVNLKKRQNGIRITNRALPVPSLLQWDDSLTFWGRGKVISDK